MKRSLEKVSELVRVEFGVSYRFPIAEGLVAIIFGILLLPMISMWNIGYFRFSEFDRIMYAVIGYPELRLAIGLFSICTWMPIVIPILSSFAIAKPFEDDYIRTLVSYPISRDMLLLVKTALVILIPAAALSFVYCFAFLTIFPQPPVVGDVAVALTGIWLACLFFGCLATLVAVTSRKVSTTAVFGIVYALIASLFSSDPTLSNVAKILLNPLSSASDFLRDSATGILYETQGMALVDIQYGFAISLVISVVLFALSLLIFRRSEV
jgi:ABC-type transport system involved in multi-copper enzyme maturation permease subunit